jgi:hypothetical protein
MYRENQCTAVELVFHSLTTGARRKKVSVPAMQSSFPHVFGGNPGSFKILDLRQEHTGVTGWRFSFKKHAGMKGRCHIRDIDWFRVA